MNKFKIATDEGVQVVEGKEIMIAGHRCFTYEKDITDDCGCYTIVFITHFDTGLQAGNDFTTKEAIKDAKKRFKEYGFNLDYAKSVLKEFGIKYPVNE
jgi:hypothetical protein